MTMTVNDAFKEAGNFLVEGSKEAQVVRNAVATGADSVRHGICGIVAVYLRENAENEPKGEYLPVYGDTICRLFAPIFILWPEFSGLLSYPVPAPEDVNLVGVRGDHRFPHQRCATAYYNFPLWVGSYGECRMRLLNFIIRYFERLCWENPASNTHNNLG